jgi:tRNA A-37 threonylcarbamoyl transferase component Bud32
MAVENLTNKNNPSACRESASAISRATSQLHWQFADPDFAANRQLQALDWYNPQSIDHAELIKENSQRQVWRFTLGNTEYYTKLYFSDGLWWKIKRRLRGPDCLKEWRVAQYAVRHNLACVKPVACAFTDHPDDQLDSILITLGIPQALPLDDYWKNIDDLDPKNRWTKINILEDALAQLLATAHHAQLAHSDLHPGNLLVEPLPQNQCRAAFVDLHSIRVGKPVSQDEAVNNLAQINQWFRKNATVTQRARFLKRYLQYREQLLSDIDSRFFQNAFKPWARALDLAAEKHAENLYASRDRRIMRKSKYFTVCDIPNHWHAHCYLKTRHPLDFADASRLELTPKDWKIALKNPKKLMDAWICQTLPIKKSRAARVCRGTLNIGQNKIPVVAKYRSSKKFLDPIWDCFRASRAIRAWKISFAMIHRQIPVAFPLAVLERRVGPFLTETLFLAEDVTPSTHLLAFITNTLPEIPQARQYAFKRTLSDQLAKLIRKMQTNNFVHRDLKGTNILIKNATLCYHAGLHPENLELVLVDLDSVVRKNKLSEKDILRPYLRLAAVADLCPYLSKTDRARFLKTALTHFGSGRPDWKSLWRKIQQHR